MYSTNPWYIFHSKHTAFKQYYSVTPYLQTIHYLNDLTAQFLREQLGWVMMPHILLKCLNEIFTTTLQGPLYEWQGWPKKWEDISFFVFKIILFFVLRAQGHGGFKQVGMLPNLYNWMKFSLWKHNHSAHCYFWLISVGFRLIKIFILCVQSFNFDQTYLNTGLKTQYLEELSLDLIFHNNFW